MNPFLLVNKQVGRDKKKKKDMMKKSERHKARTSYHRYETGTCCWTRQIGVRRWCLFNLGIFLFFLTADIHLFKFHRRPIIDAESLTAKARFLDDN